MEMQIIARVHSDFPAKFGIPRQSGLVPSLRGEIHFEGIFRNPDAVRGIEEYSHLWLLWGFSKAKKDTTIAKQLLRSATSIGANINEAVYGNSKADFISKLHISLKETGESIYWLTLLKRTNLIEYSFDELLSLAEEIKRMLIASLNTAKENK